MSIILENDDVRYMVQYNNQSTNLFFYKLLRRLSEDYYL